MIAVSACLLGYNCRYDGKSKKSSAIIDSLKSEEILPVCPEQLGGLPVPRDTSNLVGGDGFDVLDRKARVINCYGVDNTAAFVDGAYAALNQIKALNIELCFLKNKSPSCGVGSGMQLYPENKGRAKSESIAGVTAALLIREGIDVKGVS